MREFRLYLLCLVIEIFAFFFDHNFSALGVGLEEDVEVAIGGECNLISIFIEVAEVESLGEHFEDFGNHGFEFL